MARWSARDLRRGPWRGARSKGGVCHDAGMTRVELEIFADYFQFYLQDELAEGSLADAWDRDAVMRLLSVAPGTIGVGTARNTTVSVFVEVVDAAPPDTFGGNDLVTEATMDVRLDASSSVDVPTTPPDARRIPFAPGRHRAWVCYGKLDELVPRRTTMRSRADAGRVLRAPPVGPRRQPRGRSGRREHPVGRSFAPRATGSATD